MIRFRVFRKLCPVACERASRSCPAASWPWPPNGAKLTSWVSGFRLTTPLWQPPWRPYASSATGAIRSWCICFKRPVTQSDYSELLAEAGGESVGRVHMASLLTRKGICASQREAFNRFLGDGKPMHVPRILPTPQEGVALLQSVGALTVLAHPGLLKLPPDRLEMLVGRMTDMGLDALEAFHSDHDHKTTRRILALAKRHGLGVSGGSDYHGQARAEASLGRGRGNLNLSSSLLDDLRSRWESKSPIA